MKLTLQHIESQIAATRYISQESLTGLGTLTLCVLDMKNGTKIVGQSACLDANRFDAEIGKDLARKDAVIKLWQLEGYATASMRDKALSFLAEQDPVSTEWRLVSMTVTSETLTLSGGEVVSGVKQAYDAGDYYGFRRGWFAAKEANLEPGDIGQQEQAQIYEDVSSLVRHGFVTPELALKGAVAQAYKAGYAAHAKEGQP